MRVMRAQLLRGLEPILLRRPLWTASGQPQLVSQIGNFRMPEGGNAMLIGRLLVRLPGVQVGLLGVLQGLPGVLLPGQMFLFSMLFRSRTVRVGRSIVQFRG